MSGRDQDDAKKLSSEYHRHRQRPLPDRQWAVTPTDVPKRSGGILDPFYRIAATPAGVTVKDIPKNTERLSTQTLYPDTKREK